LSLLEQINNPDDLQKISMGQLTKLAQEIRDKIISVISQTGGHLASNLGVVELTIALHRVFDIKTDKIVWDVGHQCYTHKILTGRWQNFDTIRQYGGLCGFPKITESPYDSFGTGHACTAISAALGMAMARDLKGESFKVIAVVGDGALTGGMAFEALNHAGHLRKNIIVIFNDNEMSISPTVGGFLQRIDRLRTSQRYNRFRREVAELAARFGPLATQIARRIDDSARTLLTNGMLFEALGFRYFGPVEGHDIPGLMDTLERVKNIEGPIIVHIVTQKGKGYKYAEDDSTRFHSASSFDISSGQSPGIKKPSYTDIFSNTLIKLAENDKRIVAITAAMPDGTGLSKFMKKYPDRCFDVGIAEQHAVTMAAGLALQGMKPVVAIYSTFLQRAYDQIVHDVCLQNLPVTFALDRSGLVGADGPTHHGTFSFAYLRHIPNIIVMSPKNEFEIQSMIKTAIEYPGPSAVCYPRASGVGVQLPEEISSIPTGIAETLKTGKDILLIAIGSMVYPAIEAAETLEKEGISAAVVNARFVKPLDRELLIPLIRQIKKVITIEEHSINCGFGSAVSEMLAQERETYGIKIGFTGIPDKFIEHGERNLLLQMCCLTPEGIVQSVHKMLKNDGNAKKISTFRRIASRARRGFQS
jgi:1-deoxy-D-xylulose-5-phosphate synthase